MIKRTARTGSPDPISKSFSPGSFVKARRVAVHPLPALACLFALTTALPAAAYEKKGMQWKEPNPMGEVFTICATGAPPGAVDRIKEAAAKWKYTKFSFKFGPDRCIDDPSWIRNDDVNYIAFGVLAPGSSDGDIAEAITRNVPATDRMVECDIQFNINRKWYARAGGSPASGELDLLSVALHEFGHCLGLDHSKASGAVMNEMIKPGSTKRDLQDDDVKGRNALYGAP